METRCALQRATTALAAPRHARPALGVVVLTCMAGENVHLQQREHAQKRMTLRNKMGRARRRCMGNQPESSGQEAGQAEDGWATQSHTHRRCALKRCAACTAASASRTAGPWGSSRRASSRASIAQRQA